MSDGTASGRARRIESEPGRRWRDLVPASACDFLGGV